MTKTRRITQQEAVDFLRKRIEVGATIYTVTVHTARSGMMRRIRAFMVDEDRGIRDYSCKIARALDHRWNDKDGGIVIHGCGMDMGFHIVNQLSYALHGMENVGMEESEPHPNEPTPAKYVGGFSLHHRWL